MKNCPGKKRRCLQAGSSLTPPPLQNRACDFHRTRLLSIRAVVTSATTNKPTWLVSCSGWMAEFWLCSAVFSASKTPANKPSSFPNRRLPVYPIHVSVSFGFPEGICLFRQAQHKSWAISPVWASGWLPAPLPESVKRVTLFRLSISRDFRTVLYAGSRCE